MIIPLIFLYLLVAVVFGIISFVVVYHWHRYGRDSRVVAGFELVYLAVGTTLLILGLGALLTITLVKPIT